MKKLTCVIILFVLVINSTAQQLSNPCPTITIPSTLLPIPVCNTNSYVLIFEDNFSGNSLDLSKWTPQNGVIRDFPFSLEKEWLKPNNVVVNNGTLKLVAKQEITTKTYVSDYSTNPWTTATSTFNYSSGEIWTKNKFKALGKYEIYCRMPTWSKRKWH